MTEWLRNYPTAIAGLVLWAIGLIWLMPGRNARAPRAQTLGLLITAAGLITFCFSCGKPQSELADQIMFWLFGVGALLSGVLMITARNPVYAALWFALATLSTCGLFLLQSAPFLAAATIIVYAGAVIVTFLFVIMLAQQSGAAGYDRRSKQALPATISAFVLLGAICFVLQSPETEISVNASSGSDLIVADSDIPLIESDDPEMRRILLGLRGPAASVLHLKALEDQAKKSTEQESDVDLQADIASVSSSPQSEIPTVISEVPANERVMTYIVEAEPEPNALSKATAKHPVGSMKGLGRSLFGDYLFAVEIAGTLLLVAAIGAIAIAPRREQGAL